MPSDRLSKHSALRRTFRRIVSNAYRIAPSTTTKAINAQLSALNAMTPSLTGSSPIRRYTESVVQAPANESLVLNQIVKSYVAAKSVHLPQDSPYAPGAYWKLLLDREWRNYNEVIDRGDTEQLAVLLRNFFRNEALSGFWGDTHMFEEFEATLDDDIRHATLLRQFQTWRGLFPKTPLKDLEALKIGNPWGYSIEGSVVYEPAFEYHYHSDYIRQLTENLPAPVVLEIGGGFGGLGYQIRRLNPAATYIGVDLPENVLIQAYYLASALPSARILTYRAEMGDLTKEDIEAHDIILLPNFCLPNIPTDSCDFVINVRSFGEMPLPTVSEYLHQIDRVGRLWFFHENLIRNRQDDLYGVPSSEFPEMENFVKLASSQSRWPRYQAGGYPCQENLFISRQVLSGA